MKEIQRYTNFANFYSTAKILCILLDRAEWTPKTAARFKKEYVLRTAPLLIQSVSVPLVKVLRQFDCQSISAAKAQYLVEYIEQSNFSV